MQVLVILFLLYYPLVTDYLHLFFQDTYIVHTYYILLVRKASTRSSNFHSAETPAVCLWLTNLARFGCCWLKEGRIQARCVCVPPLSYHVIMGWNTFWRSIHYGPSMVSLGKTLRGLFKNPTIFNKIWWVNGAMEWSSHSLIVQSFNNFCIFPFKIILIILYYF